MKLLFTPKILNLYASILVSAKFISMRTPHLNRLRFLPVALLATLPISLVYAQQTAPATGPVNLALKKPFTTSDTNSIAHWSKGLTNGSWRVGGNNIFATGPSDTFPKTATVDLEAPVSVGYVAIGVPPFGSTKTVKVSLSTDGTAFTEVGSYVFSLRKEEKHLLSFPAMTARYVRLTYVDHYDEAVMYPKNHVFTSEVAVYAPGVAPVLTPVPPPEFTDQPAPKYGEEDRIQADFLKYHESFLKRGKEGPIGVLFLGDSITAGWKWNGKEVWAKNFEKYQSANFGIGGDRTQHVLWRIENGELDGINPKVVVLMIGTNNIGNEVEEIVKGDTKIVSEIHRRLPNTKVLLLGIFPRNPGASNPFRTKIKAVNTELAKLDDGNKTRFLDIGDKFLAPDGTIPRENMYDLLHLTPAGYQIWADAINPVLEEMMK